jgi:hypothetical protein
LHTLFYIQPELNNDAIEIRSELSPYNERASGSPAYKLYITMFASFLVQVKPNFVQIKADIDSESKLNKFLYLFPQWNNQMSSILHPLYNVDWE